MATRADVADSLFTLRTLTANPELEVHAAGGKRQYLFDGEFEMGLLGSTSTQINQALARLIQAHYTLRAISR